MAAALILIAFPCGDVAIGIAGILVGTVVDQGVQSEFQLYLRVRNVRKSGAQPHSGHGISLTDGTVVLVVLKESQSLDIGVQAVCLRGVYLCLRRHQAAGKVCCEAVGFY